MSERHRWRNLHSSLFQVRVCITGRNHQEVPEFPHLHSVSVVSILLDRVRGQRSSAEVRGQGPSGSVRHGTLFVSDLNHLPPLSQKVSKGVGLFALLRSWKQKGNQRFQFNHLHDFVLYFCIVLFFYSLFSPLWSMSSVSLSSSSSSSSGLPRVMMRSLGPAMSAPSVDRKSNSNTTINYSTTISLQSTFTSNSIKFFF